MVGFLLLFAVLVSWTRAPLYLEIQAVRSYRTVVSPWMGYVLTCRFQPTCSEYALQVLQEKGFWAGNLKIGQRLLQCSPVGVLYSAVRVSGGKAGEGGPRWRQHLASDQTAVVVPGVAGVLPATPGYRKSP